MKQWSHQNLIITGVTIPIGLIICWWVFKKTSNRDEDKKSIENKRKQSKADQSLTQISKNNQNHKKVQNGEINFVHNNKNNYEISKDKDIAKPYNDFNPSGRIGNPDSDHEAIEKVLALKKCVLNGDKIEIKPINPEVVQGDEKNLTKENCILQSTNENKSKFDENKQNNCNNKTLQIFKNQNLVINTTHTEQKCENVSQLELKSKNKTDEEKLLEKMKNFKMESDNKICSDSESLTTTEDSAELQNEQNLQDFHQESRNTVESKVVTNMNGNHNNCDNNFDKSNGQELNSVENAKELLNLDINTNNNNSILSLNNNTQHESIEEDVISNEDGHIFEKRSKADDTASDDCLSSDSENVSTNSKKRELNNLKNFDEEKKLKDVELCENLDFEVFVEFPSDLVGLLIGKQGRNIKQLKLDSGADIFVHEAPSREDIQVLQICGTQSEVESCVSRIKRRFTNINLSSFDGTSLDLSSHHSGDSPAPMYPVANISRLQLAEGITSDVIVSAIADVDCVFLQQHLHPSFQALTNLERAMSVCYSDPSTPSLISPIQVGLICAAKQQGTWYRAQIVNCFENSEEIIIKFMDYGGYATVNESSIKQIRADFVTLPFQATECYLDNIVPSKDNKNMEENVIKLQEMLKEGRFQSRITGYRSDGNPKIHLFKILMGKVTLINQSMATNGLATWVEPAPHTL